MQSIKQILNKYNPKEDKYVSREFQSFGIHLAEELDDYRHRSLYIKLAKTTPRPLLEKALSFVSDSNARNKGALFMWQLKKLKSQSSNVKTIPTNSIRAGSRMETTIGTAQISKTEK